MTAIRAAAQVDEAAVVELTRALVRVRSVNDPAGGSNEAGAAEVVRQQMQDWGWSPQVCEAAHGATDVVTEDGLMLGAKHFARTWRELLPGEIDGVVVPLAVRARRRCRSRRSRCPTRQAPRR